MHSKFFQITVLLLAVALPAMAQKDTTHTVTAAVRDNARIATMYGIPATDLFAFNADKAESLATVKKLSQVRYPIGVKLVVPREKRKWNPALFEGTLSSQWVVSVTHKETDASISYSREGRLNIVAYDDSWRLYTAELDHSRRFFSSWRHEERGGLWALDPLEVIVLLKDRNQLPRYIDDKIWVPVDLH